MLAVHLGILQLHCNPLVVDGYRLGGRLGCQQSTSELGFGLLQLLQHLEPGAVHVFHPPEKAVVANCSAQETEKLREVLLSIFVDSLCIRVLNRVGCMFLFGYKHHGQIRNSHH